MQKKFTAAVTVVAFGAAFSASSGTLATAALVCPPGVTNPAYCTWVPDDPPPPPPPAPPTEVVLPPAGDGTPTPIDATSAPVTISGDGGNYNLVVTGNQPVTIELSGGGNTISASGPRSAVTLGGDRNRVTLTGERSRVTLSGSNNTVRATGASATVRASGAANNVTLGNRGGTVTAPGPNQVVRGGNGADRVSVGAGSDIRAGGGRDTVTVRTAATVRQSSNRRIRIKTTRVDGGAGNDKITVRVRTRVIIKGGSGNDILVGGPGRTTIEGGAGNDRITAGSGVTTIKAGPGNDRIFSRNGKVDTIDGGPGRDVATVDRRDKVKNVERVIRGRRCARRRGWSASRAPPRDQGAAVQGRRTVREDDPSRPQRRAGDCLWTGAHSDRPCGPERDGRFGMAGFGEFHEFTNQRIA